MNLLLNGQPADLSGGISVAALIEQLKLGEKRVAVELNGEIVPRSQHASTLLQDGDRIEIVQAIGGG